MEVEKEGELTMMVVKEVIAPFAPLKKPKIDKSPYEILQLSKTSVEDIVAQILAIKKEAKPKTELRELVTQMFLNLVSLRQANRTILLEEDRVKAETERAKAPVDFTTLQLHNLMYEKSHYVKAIKACKDFKSKYPDIELASEEEFFRDAPEEIKGSVNSNDTAHNLMLKRLNYELYQRKQLCKQREKLEQSKKNLMETIANQKKFLSSLPSHLKSLKKASLPVQNQLGIQHTKKLKQHHSAELLPSPLYVIYTQFLAQKEAFGVNIDLEIVGSVKDAQADARHQAYKESGNSINAESSRAEDEALDEDDDGQRRKRPKRVPNKENIDKGGIYQVHPLKIILHINDDEVSDPKSSKLITLKFEYLSKLNAVCVGIEGSHEGPESNILCNLFPDDTGLELPLQSAKLYVGDGFAFDEKRTSRPYKWAQHLAGIDFLPEVCPLLDGSEVSSGETSKLSSIKSGLSLYRQQNRIETVVQRICSRKKAQLALLKQLDSLKKLKWPELTYKSLPWAKHSSICNLHNWSQASPKLNQVSSISVTDQVQDHPIEIDLNEKPENSKNEIESAREDGELPSLISKSIITPMYKLKSPSFKKVDDDLDLLMLDSDSDLVERAQVKQEIEDAGNIRCENSWIDYGVQEFCLVLMRKLKTGDINYKLEAKIKISMEYPLRPPLFALSLSPKSAEKYNELRAMEAEVNVNIVKMVPSDQENYVLTHQLYGLVMLFDLYMDEALSSSPKGNQILDRSFRGRDRRKMISWEDMKCT